MSKFDHHFRMSEAEAAEYAAEKLEMFAGARALECSEIGDGNINYVFRVRDPASGRSAIVKQADASTRSGTRVLGFDRNRIETEILQMEGRYAPGLVPEVYFFDPVMSCVCMEDLSDHVILRYELIAHKRFPRLVEDITDFMVLTLVPTLDVVADPVEKKELVKRYTNPNLCAITEQLVYTDPYTNASGRNKVFPPNAEFVEREIYGDADLHFEVAKLKYKFMNDAQALIHGDLHTGSIFAKPDSTKVIDPEFAFFGPIGYDLGNVVGNFCFAWANAAVTMGDSSERESYIAWLDGAIAGTIDRFALKFRALLEAKAADKIARGERYARWFADTVLEDAAGVAGLEMIRRTVGVTKVADIARIADEGARTRAERLVMLCAKDFILRRGAHLSGGAYVHGLHEVLETLSR